MLKWKEIKKIKKKENRGRVREIERESNYLFCD
jgi:hypothetical protein